MEAGQTYTIWADKETLPLDRFSLGRAERAVKKYGGQLNYSSLSPSCNIFTGRTSVSASFSSCESASGFCSHLRKIGFDVNSQPPIDIGLLGRY